jgi:hypothetical protein
MLQVTRVFSFLFFIFFPSPEARLRMPCHWTLAP